MLVTESAAETVIISARDAAVRSRVAETLNSAGFFVLQANNGLSATEMLRYYCGAIDWIIVVHSNISNLFETRLLIFEYQFYNPLRPVICIVDGIRPIALERLPDILFLQYPGDSLSALLKASKISRYGLRPVYCLEE